MHAGPTKLGVICPGMGEDGKLQEHGIPAALVTAFLSRHAVVPTRTTDHMVLFLFSIGVTTSKWGTLINMLLEFKRAYDRNAPLSTVVPNVVAAAPKRYAKMGMRDLGDETWDHMKENRQGYWQGEAYANLPTPFCTPRKAFQQLMTGAVDLLPLDQMAHRVAAVGVIPYPPGIPIVMPGEHVGSANGPWLTYIRTLQEWGQRFPGFEAEVEGAELQDGSYHIYCLQ